MNFKKKFLILIAIIFFVSCNKSDDTNNEENPSYNFTINNVYLEPLREGEPNCWVDLVVTDGSFSETETEYIPNPDIKNILFFNDIHIPNCEYDYPMEFNWDRSGNGDPNMGMEGTNPIFNITIQNGNATNFTDLTEEVLKSRLTFNSVSSFSYRIELNNGQIIEKNYNGLIQIIADDKGNLSI